MIIMSWLLLILIVVVLVYLYKKYNDLFRGLEEVDTMFEGDGRLPFIGTVHHLFGDIYETGMRGILKYKTALRIWLGPILVVMLVHPRLVEKLLSSSTHLEKSDGYNSLYPWIGRGLLTSFGNKWKRTRKVVTPAFHFNILEEFMDTFTKNAVKLCHHLDNLVGRPQFDIMKYVKMEALDNVCESTMGVEIHAQDNPDTEYVKAVKRMCHIVLYRNLRPWLRIDWLFNLTSLGREQKKLLSILHGFTKSVIDDRIAERKLHTENKNGHANNHVSNRVLGKKKKKAFLDLLLDLVDTGDLPIEQVQEEVDTFMFEVLYDINSKGHDTITSALSFCTYNLGLYPHFQEEIYKELCEIFRDSDRVPTTQDLAQMKCLERFIKESLRLYPSVPVLGRKIHEKIQLDENTYIPAGAQVIIPIFTLHVNDTVWDNPLEFQPSRFLPENVVKRNPFAFIPFSAGARNCIGMKFAMMEMKVTLSQLLRKFEVKMPTPRIPLKVVIEIILDSATGFNICIDRRIKSISEKI